MTINVATQTKGFLNSPSKADVYVNGNLGACNPALAYESLQQELEIGLLLPCNLIVYELDGKTVVSAVDAARMLSVVGNPKLKATATCGISCLHSGTSVDFRPLRRIGNQP